MKRLSILVMFVLSASVVFANPIMPRYISEIYFDGDHWTLELYNSWGGEISLDGIILHCESGSAQFIDGITLCEDEPLLITFDNMQTPLYIDKTGDLIEFLNDAICWGDYEYSNVNSPFQEQSLVQIDIGDYYSLVKENQPSLGENPFSVSSMGTLSGNVYDVHNEPVQNAVINYLWWGSVLNTDETGYFENNVYGMNYSVTVDINDVEYGEMDVTVEPDSTTFLEFYTDYDPVNAENEELQITNCELRNHPNPFNPSTTIYFDISNQPNEPMRVEIFNSKGQKIEELQITNYELRMNTAVWNAEKYASGVYYYSLISGEKELASNKMLLLK
jgi:hypothetical protein